MLQVALVWACVCVTPALLRSQSVNISGVVNIYAKVHAISGDSVVVDSSTGYAPGDEVLLIQMEGAQIDTTDTPSFGTVQQYSGAGKYEFASVRFVYDSLIVLDTILNAYDPAQMVQLIRVPHYRDATVSKLLTALPWNDTVGGVLAIDICGKLTLSNNINVSGLGFRGGVSDFTGEGPIRPCITDFYVSDVSNGGAKKGEGFASLYINDGQHASGLGAAANGGGGGNSEEGGGGGGGNMGIGGSGGQITGRFGCSGDAGIGGNSISYATDSNRIFMGGGGGGGDNDDYDTINTINPGPIGPGANGGGIVIIRADTLIANGHTIFANGNNALLANEGAGGGGAGGTVLLDVLVFSTRLNVQVNGGAGGNADNSERQMSGLTECSGGGGGGGGGLVWVNASSLNPNVIVTMNYGNGGGSSNNCPSSYGSNGKKGGILTNLQIPQYTQLVNVAVKGEATYCPGDSIRDTLTVQNGYAPYLWTTGDTAKSIIVTQPGSYAVSADYFPGAACNNSVSAPVTINVRNTMPPSVAGPAGICPGDTITLTASGGYVAYLWSNGDTTQSIRITQSGRYILSVQDTGGCTVRDAVNIVASSITVPSVAAIPKTSICEGDSVTLIADSGYANYLWSTGATARAITVNTSGTYHVLVMDTLGCKMVSAPVTVIVNPLPAATAGPDAAICPGDSVQLGGAGGDASLTYQWSPAAGLSCANCPNPVARPDSTTSYILTVRDTNGCTSSAAVMITVQPKYILRTDTTVINFGSVEINTAKDSFVVVTDPDTAAISVAALNVNAVTSPLTISIAGGDYQNGSLIPPGNSGKILLRYVPTQAGIDTAEFCIVGAGPCPDSQCVLLIGEATDNIVNMCALMTPPIITATVPVQCTAELLNDIPAHVDSVAFDLEYDPQDLYPAGFTPSPCALWSELPKPGIERVHLAVCAQPLTAGILAEAKFMPLVNQKDTIFSSVMIDSIQFYPTETVLPSGCSVPFTIIPLCGLAGVSFANTTSLAQNYPNPFTGTTTIHVTLSQEDAQGAQLKVYNMLGEEVADLTNELTSDAEMPFASGEANTGVYYYVLQTASGRLTRQMFVVK